MLAEGVEVARAGYFIGRGRFANQVIIGFDIVNCADDLVEDFFVIALGAVDSKGWNVGFWKCGGNVPDLGNLNYSRNKNRTNSSALR